MRQLRRRGESTKFRCARYNRSMDCSRAQLVSSPRPSQLTFKRNLSFAGVQIRVAASDEICTRLAGLPGVFPAAGASASSLGLLKCELERAPDDEDPTTDRALRWRWEGERCHLTVPGGVAVLMGRGPTIEVRARVMFSDRALTALLAGLASVVAGVRGGLVLHSASVEWRGRALAFVGPSGAGKTTACRHVPGALLFSRDRILVAPLDSGQWFAHSLPGGAPPVPDIPGAGVPSLPLYGVLGLRHATRHTHLEALSPIQRATLLRQCTMDGEVSENSEGRLFESFLALASRVPMARLHFKLETSLAEVLSSWTRIP